MKKVVPQSKGIVIKVKSALFERVYRALKMKPGDVMAGAQRRTKAKRASSV